MSASTMAPEMQRLSRAFEEALSTGDVSALEHVYAPDARILPPGTEEVRGLAGIQNFWGAAVQALGVTGARLRTTEMNVQGDTAYEIGRCELDTRDGGNNALEVKYVVVWQKQGDQWRWLVDIWNTSS